MASWLPSTWSSAIAGHARTAISAIAGFTASAVVEKIVDKAFSYLPNRMLDGGEALKRVEMALPKIRAVIGIAEALKTKDPNSSELIEQFRYVVAAAEDVLDEFKYKELEDMVKNRDRVGGLASSSKKSKTSAINDDLLKELKKVITMLDQIASGLDDLLQHAAKLGIRYLSESQHVAYLIDQSDKG